MRRRNGMTKQETDKINQLSKRAVSFGLIKPKEIASLSIDLELAFEHFNLDLDKFLKFDDFNFCHDIIGIRQHIDRKNKKFRNCFLPRCAQSKTEEM